MSHRLESLNTFTKLTSLEMPIIMLLGWKVDTNYKLANLLPSSLQTLCQTDDLYEMEEDQWRDNALLPLISAYLEQKDEYAPELEQFTLQLHITKRDWRREMCTKLGAVCICAKVKCLVFCY